MQIEDNAKKAKEAADKLFPGEKWKEEDERIFVSPRRKRTNFTNEFRDAQILRDLGSTVYLVPEDSRRPGRKYDAIVNGLIMEFKKTGRRASGMLSGGMSPSQPR
jgi:signal recognition particle subunit SEC65